jgi:hypothetical protein
VRVNDDLGFRLRGEQAEVEGIVGAKESECTRGRMKTKSPGEAQKPMPGALRVIETVIPGIKVTRT